jgi:hypothetical protein
MFLNILWTVGLANVLQSYDVQTQQQKVSLYAKWFHWILSEFTSCNEWGPMKKEWIHWSNE